MNKHTRLLQALLPVLTGLSLTACSPAENITTTKLAATVSDNSAELTTTNSKDIPAAAYLAANEIYNYESVIPPQCYTKTESVNNPCYTCHQTYPNQTSRTNMMFDGHLQGLYAFSDEGVTNHWKNLFKNRSESIKNTSDTFIKDYIKQDNYSRWAAKHPEYQAAVIDKLATPDQAFETNGIAKDGSHWVAFNYKPFPGTFWPTNGSTGDVMIRLDNSFREINGDYVEDAYFANLTLVEMAIKDVQALSVPGLSEVALNTDLNGDGKLSDKVDRMVRRSHYVGDASDVALYHMLYPQGTEILHTVRYVGVNDDGSIYNAERMKEVRYMKKHFFKDQNNLKAFYYQEQKEKHFENLPKTISHGKEGIANNFGWTINAWIEDTQGELRQQEHQELAFCNGCHKSIGSTIDQTFSFPRKVAGADGWGYINLKAITDVPNINETAGEYATYMARTNGGDEFRQNTEMKTRWFDESGKVNLDAVNKVASIYELITPSSRRALDLNKAYHAIVKEQSYIFGRDAVLSEATNVHKEVDETQKPLLPEHRYQWDLRLNWDKTEQPR